MVAGLSLDCMDTSVEAKEHFGNYVNGKWAEKNPIPSAYGRWGFFMKLRDQVLDDCLELCNSASEGESAKKLSMFWKTAMDTENLESQGVAPLSPLFSTIDECDNTVPAFMSLLGSLHAQGLPLLFETGVEADFKDSTVTRLCVSQGGLGLPDRDFYLEEEKADIKAKYAQHIEAQLVLAGKSKSDAADVSAVVLRLETDLAQKSKSKVEMREISAMYNPQSPQDLRTHAFDWESFFKTFGLDLSDDFPHIINGTPLFFDHLATVISTESLCDWKKYLTWHVLRCLTPYLPESFVSQQFELSKLLSGAKELEPRWKRVIGTVNSHIGQLLGVVYCDAKFTKTSKEKCIEMIENLREALKQTIEGLEWMGEGTKVKALEKLASMGVKVGFPDKWIDYTSLKVTSESFVTNVLAANEFEHERDMKRVNKPVEKHLWEMAPQQVNAYYHPLRNEIVFPAAILQPPAFDASRDDALNYGAIGAVIGHEMTHGFDDQGRLFDAAGNMKNWWEEEDTTKFNALAKTVIDQYGSYKVVGTNVNGELTQGENIADIGGVKIAFRAFQILMEKEGRPENFEGFTPEQRFFISYGQFWASSVREEMAKTMLKVDPHSPAELRAYCPLKNIQDFYDAFDVKKGDGMYLEPEKRVTIWG